MGKAFLTSWKTTVCGILAIVCAGTNLAGLLPPGYETYLHTICTVALALGLIAAKDGNVSNAATPTEAKKVG